MELYDKLNLLEEKIDKIVAEAMETRREKERVLLESEELSNKLTALEEENGKLREDRDAAREKIESLIMKLG